jgi:hypothetical protein
LVALETNDSSEMVCEYLGTGGVEHVLTLVSMIACQ